MSSRINRIGKWTLAPLAIMIAVMSSTWESSAQQKTVATQTKPTVVQTQRPTPSTKPPQPKPSADPAANLPHNWIVPVAGKITNPFGNSYQYFGVYRGGHTGVDISAPKGAAIKAVADGKVVRIFAVPNMRYGQYLVLQHSPGLFSLYGHTQTVMVKLGQLVKQGQQIATVGNSGAAGYPHLHIEAINRLPFHDGAWGYLYICYNRSEKFTFINQNAFVISAIQRQYGNSACSPRPMHEAVTYFNPENLWSQTPVIHTVAQPENDEWNRYKHSVQSSHAGPESAAARPIVPNPKAPPQSLKRSAAPDKSTAPGE